MTPRTLLSIDFVAHPGFKKRILSIRQVFSRRLFMSLGILLFTTFRIAAATYNIADGDVEGLIAAINASNTNPGPDIINLAQNGSYTLTYVAGPDSWHGPTGLPIVQGVSGTQRAFLTINGNGPTIQRSDAPGIPEFRIFHTLYAYVVFDSVTIKNGRVHGPNRCGGGGLYLNVSDTIIINSTITENWADEGGGMCNNNTSTLTIENSTISYNTAYGGRTGGGLLNFSGGLVRISNSTVYENQADGSPGFECEKHRILGRAHFPAVAGNRKTNKRRYENKVS